MQISNLQNLLKYFHCNPPANNSMIEDFELKSGLQLPQDYIEFLKSTNGGEGFIGANTYLILWKIDEVLEYNIIYEVSEYAPHLVLIGSDGGGEAFAFDTIVFPWSIVQVPFVGMDRVLIQVVASNFPSFLQFLYDQ